MIPKCEIGVYCSSLSIRWRAMWCSAAKNTSNGAELSQSPSESQQQTKDQSLVSYILVLFCDELKIVENIHLASLESVSAVIPTGTGKYSFTFGIVFFWHQNVSRRW